MTINSTIIPESISTKDLITRAGSNLPPERVVFEGKVFDGTLDHVNDPIAAIDAFSGAVYSTFEMTERSEVFEGFTVDELAIALDVVLNRQDGGVPQVIATNPGESPGTRRVSIGYDLKTKMEKRVVVPDGAVSIPGLRRINPKLPANIRVIDNGAHSSPELYAQVIRGDQGRLDGIFGFIRDWASANSIYLNQVVDVNFQFMNLTGFKPENVALTRKQRLALDLMVREQFKHPHKLDVHGQSPKTGMLFYGPPGGGKTMTAQMAEYAVIVGGGTVIHVDPSLGIRGLQRADKMAQRLLDAGHVVLIVFEDVEKLAVQDRAKVLEILDGVSAKNTRRIVIGTTNFLETIDRAMIRPGRFDQVIFCGLPDREAFEKLINVLIKDDARGDIDYDEAFPHFDGYSYAMISNAVSLIIRSAIAYSDGDVKVETSDLINAADMVRDHHNLLNEDVVSTKVSIEDLIAAANQDQFDSLSVQVEESAWYDATDYDQIGSIVASETDSVVEGRVNGARVEDEDGNESRIATC